MCVTIDVASALQHLAEDVVAIVKRTSVVAVGDVLCALGKQRVGLACVRRSDRERNETVQEKSRAEREREREREKVVLLQDCLTCCRQSASMRP